MCLYYCEKATRALQKRLNRNETIVAYKVVYLDNRVRNKNSNLRSIFFIDYNYRVGWNFSNRRSVKLTKKEVSTNKINYGIHVYLLREVALFHKRHFPVHRLLPVTCHLNHFVAASNQQEAVFRKVFISQQSYNKARKESES